MAEEETEKDRLNRLSNVIIGAALLVEDSLIVEVKAIERLERVHSAQLLSYLRQLRLRLGLLIDFNVRWLRDGIKRVVNDFPE